MDNANILVIGYGNTLRRDDGVGPRVAEAVAAMNLPWVRVISRAQLAPELAEAVSQTDAVIFVDAAVNTTNELQFRELNLIETRQAFTHTLDPPSLLALAKALFGAAPKAWTLSIPVEDLGFGEGFSWRGEINFQSALKLIENLLYDQETQSIGPEKLPAPD